MDYPEAKSFKIPPATDQYLAANGSMVSIIDKFRFLENPDLNETKEWIAKEQELMGNIINNLEMKKSIKKLLQMSMNHS